MPAITALKPSNRQPDRVHVYIDGAFLATVDAFTVAQRQLQVGVAIDAAGIAALVEEAEVGRLVDRCLRYLSFRPRSEQELRLYLRRAKATPEQTDAVVAELRRLKLVDDAAFARFWRESRDRASPRGQHLLRAELRSKGVAAEEVAGVLPESDDEAVLAGRAAERYLRQVRGLPWPEFRRKLLAFLQRRGFDYGVASPVVRELWETVSGEAAEQEEIETP